jgi:hypothetical protein
MPHRVAAPVVFAVSLALMAGAGLTGTRAGAAPVPKHLMKAPPVYFPTRVGAKWVYLRSGQEETHAVTKVEAKEGEMVVTVEREQGGKTTPYWVVAVRSDGLFLVAESGEAYDPPWCLLKCPVEVGKSWDGNSEREDYITLVGRRTVAAAEKLKVPAGEFEALRITSERVTSETGDARVRSSTTYWYAPHVGVVQIDRDPPHLVLKAFVPGKE